MSLKKPDRPLNTAVTALGILAVFYSVTAAAVTVLWSQSVDCAVLCLTLFFAGAAVLLIYALYALRLNTRRPVRDRLNCWYLLTFVPAALVLIALELYGGYLLNTVNVRRDRLNDLYYKELDEEKLCTALMTGADPQDEFYQKSSPQEILKSGKVPKFRGVYSGDFATSFADGGKIYLKLGRYSLQQMKIAAEKRDSSAFLKYAKQSARIIVRAAGTLRDPEHAASILAKEFSSILQESLTATFPEGENFKQLLTLLGELRERYENGMLNNIIYDTQAALTRYDALLKKPSTIAKILKSDLSCVWSDADLLAGRLFPTVRRLRIIQDYADAVEYLHICRGVGASTYSVADKRIKALGNALNKMAEKRHFAAEAFAPDFRKHLSEAAWGQHLIENAMLACEVEHYRRENKRLPDKLTDVQSVRITAFPAGHIDGSEYKLIKGKFKDKSGKEYSGYAISVPTGSFVITDRK